MNSSTLCSRSIFIIKKAKHLSESTTDWSSWCSEQDSELYHEKVVMTYSYEQEHICINLKEYNEEDLTAQNSAEQDLNSNWNYLTILRRECLK